MPWLSVIVPTIGRPTLERTIESIRSQEPDSDKVEIVLVGDSFNGTYKLALDDLIRSERVWHERYAEHDGGIHAWGHPQRQHGQSIARGQWLWWLQDDDVATPGSLAVIRTAIELNGQAPLLFKVHQHHGGRTIWQTEEIKRGNVDADCIVCPNDQSKLGRWGMGYDGDCQFIRETVTNFGDVRWLAAVIAEARP